MVWHIKAAAEQAIEEIDYAIKAVNDISDEHFAKADKLKVCSLLSILRKTCEDDIKTIEKQEAK